jgi:hypothetical protein
MHYLHPESAPISKSITSNIIELSKLESTKLKLVSVTS